MEITKKDAGIAMSTIPLSFDEHQINRTVIGGKSVKAEKTLNISVILLNSSGSHFKLQLFESLLACNFHSIISVENDANNYSIEDVSKKFPEVKFIVPLEKATDGEMINLAVSEIKTDYFLVLRDNLHIPSGFIQPNMADRLVESQIFCVVPRLLDKFKTAIPSQSSPFAEKSHFEIAKSSIVNDGMKTIYPFDNIALYNRKKFIQLGGFDSSITSPYWQTLDLALRSWLWGEETRLTTILQFSYVDDMPVEDTTVNLDYLRYYLKNQVPKIKNDVGVIKRSAFFRFLNSSSCGYLEARRQFNAAKFWVWKNRFKFKKDLQQLIQEWGSSNEK